jgi:hypothetical protein
MANSGGRREPCPNMITRLTCMIEVLSGTRKPLSQYPADPHRGRRSDKMYILAKTAGGDLISC